ncbi:MAG: hypothetical protein NT098_02040 [Candidatus Parcubacteria bacterium]|nr:hypothetical protein [Candidatus Parcubacteria bacterium]
MEQPPNTIEDSSYFEVKFGRDTTKSAVIKAIKEEKPVQFLCTRFGDLYLSNMGHDSMKRVNGIDADEVATRGWMKLSYDLRELQVVYEEAVSPAMKKSILNVFKNLQSKIKEEQ